MSKVDSVTQNEATDDRFDASRASKFVTDLNDPRIEVAILPLDELIDTIGESSVHTAYANNTLASELLPEYERRFQNSHA